MQAIAVIGFVIDAIWNIVSAVIRCELTVERKPEQWRLNVECGEITAVTAPGTTPSLTALSMQEVMFEKGFNVNLLSKVFRRCLGSGL